MCRLITSLILKTLQYLRNECAVIYEHPCNIDQVTHQKATNRPRDTIIFMNLVLGSNAKCGTLHEYRQLIKEIVWGYQCPFHEFKRFEMCGQGYMGEVTNIF